MRVLVPCSHCKKPRDPAVDFTQRKHASCTKTLRSGERKTYRTRHPKGRSYVCHDCEAQRMRETRAKQRGNVIKRPSMQGRKRCSHIECDAWATWHSPGLGAWRACDAHYLPGDEPMTSEATGAA